MPKQNRYNNNFDFLRIIFASFVVISHSISLSGIHSKNIYITFCLDNLAQIGVYGFFVISGYLVSQSLERSPTVKQFIRKRILRIFPGLIMMGIFTSFILGGIFTSLPKSDYYSNASTYLNFLSTIFLIPIYKCLPGLFENNTTGCAVNGSLWTIRYELLFYVILGLYYLVRKRKNASIVLWAIAFVSLSLWYFYFEKHLSEQANYHVGRIVHLSYLFFSGVLFNYVSIVIKQNCKKIFLAILIVKIICIIFPYFSFVENLFFPLLIISAGLCYIPQLHISSKFGDISYGIYIYAYPLQQLLSEKKITSNIYIFILYSLLLSIVFGFMSWHLVEKKFLKKRIHNP